MEAIINLSKNNELAAKQTIENVIRQAQNGVTVFSVSGILYNILTDLDYQTKDN